MQEFGNAGAGGGGGSGRDEKITLGTVRLNLSEYVEESEALLRPGAGPVRPNSSGSIDKPSGHARQRSSLSGISSLGSSIGLDIGRKASPSSQAAASEDATATNSDVEDGVIRRYLMQDSKINSTLKIGILMVQVEGERNYVAPPLKTAPVFGGIAGMMPGEPLEPPVDRAGAGSAEAGVDGAARVASLNKSRDTHEVQDMYRRALAASWACQPDELPADECIEDIFAGGNGFLSNGSHGVEHDHPARHEPSGGGVARSSSGTGRRPAPSSRSATDLRQQAGGITPSRDDSASGADEDVDGMNTLRPRDLAKLRHHFRAHSGPSDRAPVTAFPAFEDPGATGGGGGGSGGAMTGLGVVEPRHIQTRSHHERRDVGKDEGAGRNRSGSLASLATTTGSSSDRGRDGFKRPKGVEEYEVREDMVAWSLPTAVS